MKNQHEINIFIILRNIYLKLLDIQFILRVNFDMDHKVLLYFNDLKAPSFLLK